MRRTGDPVVEMTGTNKTLEPHAMGWLSLQVSAAVEGFPPQERGWCSPRKVWGLQHRRAL